MKLIGLLLLFSHFQVFCQTIHLPHEVEKAALPSGGLPYLNQFITANLQVPFSSAVKGLKGKVYVKGVVEPDGSMSQIEVTRGIDSLCNREAIRLMNLYKAWQPAIIKGEKVRQSMVYPVIFQANANPDFDTLKFAYIHYFDDKFRTTESPAAYENRSIVPVDSQGYVRQDVIYEQLKSRKWKLILSIPFQKKEIWHKFGFPGDEIDSVKAYQVSVRDENNLSYAPEAIFQMNNKLLALTEYTPEGKASLQKEYDLNGMLRKTNILTDSSETEIRWYQNGQIQSLIEKPVNKGNEITETLYINRWDPDGTQLLKNGDGHWKSVGSSYEGKVFVEEGRVVEGRKNGIWKGKLKDSTLLYQEQYELGILQEGFSVENGEKISYNEAVKQPYFKGGVREFYKFLATNIRYPSDAARRGIRGRVQLSFVVCEDGSLCDYKVDQSAGRDLDSEALRVVKKMNGLWQPGALRGKNVKVKYNLPINFDM